MLTVDVQTGESCRCGWELCYDCYFTTNTGREIVFWKGVWPTFQPDQFPNL